MSWHDGYETLDVGYSRAHLEQLREKFTPKVIKDYHRGVFHVLFKVGLDSKEDILMARYHFKPEHQADETVEMLLGFLGEASQDYLRDQLEESY